MYIICQKNYIFRFFSFAAYQTEKKQPKKDWILEVSRYLYRNSKKEQLKRFSYVCFAAYWKNYKY